ncbi:MAG: hypothetical protein K2L64_03065, partial [Ureaplasma sp.]|nr:hypothetical protein [Ureaplasma sp.]
LSNYNYLSKFPQKLFSRLNTNFDLIFTKNGIKPIISKDVDFELNSRSELNKPVTIKQFKKFKMSLRFISFLGSLGDTASIIKDAFFDTEDNTPWTALSFFIGLFGFASHIAGIFIPGLGIVGSILNFLASTLYKKEFFSYVFETESVKYIWNGGVEESWLCGIIKGEQTTIDDMKLLNPMQVVKPNNLQGYYYNGKIYGDFSKLKNTQLNDILNGRYSNNKFQKVYSLLNLEKETNPISNLYDDSIVNLVKNVSEHIKNLISNDTFEDDSIVSKSNYKFGSFVYDDSDTLQNNTNKVLDNIKPMLIAQLPTLNPKGHKLVNKPIYNDANGYDDGSLKSYKLPGFSWTAEGGYYQNPDTNFIIIDQNIVDDKDEENKDENNKDNENGDNSSNSSNNKSTSSNKPNKIINFKEELEKQFYASFDVDSKEIDSQFINSANLFSNLSSKTESNFCYFAKGRDNERKMFLSKNDAINWLLTEFNYKTHYVMEQLKTIFINDLVFSNYDDYVNWVYSNIVEGEQ